jgi:hypothetical protein
LSWNLWSIGTFAAMLACGVGGKGTEKTGKIAAPAPHALTARDTAFLDTLEQRTFQFFWETANRRNGLVPDRYPTPSFSSIAAVGFGLTAYPIGVERGYVSRADARQHVLTTLRWLWNAPQGDAATGVTGYKGFFYHFLDMESGHRYKAVELSSIDTALLLGGVLFCQSYFDQPDSSEATIRAYADSLYRRVDWQWMQHHAPPLVTMGWTPEQGFITYDWQGYNEAMLLYILALGSPTHAVDSSAWSAWTSTYKWGSYYGYTHVGFAPLFGHQYSQVWLDLRGIRDAYMRKRGIDYFENSRRATLAQQHYAIDNPAGWTDYGAQIWGLTASDGPGDFTRTIGGRTRQFLGYAARGASFTEVRDDGTVAPTAAGGSIAFAPEIVIPTLVAMRERYGDHLFSTYGFLDAFNPTFRASEATPQGTVVPGVGWFDVDYLGIDQGPIIAMIENYRSGLIWRYMRRNPAIVRGLRRAGFTGGWLDGGAATP